MSQFKVGDVIKSTNQNSNLYRNGKFLIIKSVEPIIDEDVQKQILGYTYEVLVEPSNRTNRNGEKIDDRMYIDMINGFNHPYEKDEQRGGKYRKSRRSKNNKKSRRSKKNRKSRRFRK